MSIVIAVLIFGLIITIHELGHFLVAKACKVRVNEFAIGMGPQIFKRKKGETTYSLRIFPIGGFVAMEGEDESSNDDRALNKKPVWQRLSITVAGAIMNLILGLIIVIILTSVSDNILTTQVSKFTENAISAKTGLEVNDTIVKVNGSSILTDADLSYQLQSDEDGIYSMQVIRNGQRVDLDNVQLKRDVTEDGNSYIRLDFYVNAQEKTVVNVISYSFKKSVSIAKLIWITFGDLVKGRYGLNDLSGPVGIVNAIGEVITPEQAVDFSKIIQNLLYMMSFITINVGIFNLLPIPALDGGRIIFLIIEAIRRKPIKPEHEGLVHFVGFALLMVLMVVVTFNDIIKLL